MLPVEITSAIELDQATTESLGETIGERAGRKVTLAARVDPDILGGIVLGWATRSSTPLFATDWSSCAGTLPKEPLRKRHADQPRRDHKHPEEPHRGTRRRTRRADRGRHRAVGRRRHRAHARPRELHVLRDARAAPRRHRPRAEPRVRQRRRRAVRRLGAHLRGRHRQAHRRAARHPRRRAAARADRRPARPPARRQRRDRRHRDAARPSSRPPASSSASRSPNRCRPG